MDCLGRTSPGHEARPLSHIPALVDHGCAMQDSALSELFAVLRGKSSQAKLVERFGLVESHHSSGFGHTRLSRYVFRHAVRIVSDINQPLRIES